MENAKALSQAHRESPSQVAENLDPMGSAHAGQFGYYGGVNTMGHKTGNPQSAWATKDVQSDAYSPPVRQQHNFMPVNELQALREQAYTANENKSLIDSIAQKALFAVAGPVGAVASTVTGLISGRYSEKYSGTAEQRAALGYGGPGYPTGMPDVGPFMDPKDRDFSDARWSDDFDPEKGARVDIQGNVIEGPTSPAGGEVITVAAPPGAPDQRVTQFKSLYPPEWTETLTDEEIIEMVENPDQLRYWLSWRQT